MFAVRADHPVRRAFDPGCWLEGGGDGFDALYREYAPIAWGLGRAVAGNRDDSAQAVVHGFGQMSWSGGALLDTVSSLWELLGGVYTCGADLLCRRGGLAPSPDDHLESAFLSLPLRWRAVYWLMVVEDLDPSVVAVSLGLSVGTAERLSRRARTRLEGLIEHSEALRERRDLVQDGLAAWAGQPPVGLEVAARPQSEVPNHRPRKAVRRPRASLERQLMASCLGLMAAGIVGATMLGQVAPGISADPGTSYHRPEASWLGAGAQVGAIRLSASSRPAAAVDVHFQAPSVLPAASAQPVEIVASSPTAISAPAAGAPPIATTTPVPTAVSSQGSGSSGGSGGQPLPAPPPPLGPVVAQAIAAVQTVTGTAMSQATEAAPPAASSGSVGGLIGSVVP